MFQLLRRLHPREIATRPRRVGDILTRDPVSRDVISAGHVEAAFRLVVHYA